MPDLRHGNRLTYPIDYLLLIVFSALMSGFKTWNQFALYAELHEKDLRKVYKRLSKEECVVTHHLMTHSAMPLVPLTQ